MSPKAIVLSVIGMVIILAGGVALASRGQKSAPPVASYSTQESDRPKAETGETLIDLGEIKVNDTQARDFDLKNGGDKPLQILNINSSCGCTVGQVIYNGETSREYGMHQQSGYVTEIAPGESAIIRLTYRPFTMPVFGPVQREVYVTTNDPQAPKLVFGIKTFVTK